MIICDIHESKSNIPSMIEREGIKTKIQSLDIGDYVLGRIVIERKGIRDFFSSLYSRRLFEQLFNLAQADRPMLYIIGSIPTFVYRKRKRIPITKEDYQHRYNTVRNIMAMAWNSHGVMSVWVKSNSEFIDDLKYLYSKITSKPSVKPVVKKSSTIPEIKSDILSCIPSVGRVVANELAKRYSIHRLGEFSVRRLSSLKVSGRKLGKKAEHIVKVLNE